MPWRWHLPWAVAAFICHGALIATCNWPAPRQLAGDEIRYWQEGSAWLAGANPEIDLLWPPLYSHVVGWSGLGGEAPRWGLLVVFQLLCLGIAAWGLALFSRRRGLPASIAASLGWSLTLMPAVAAYAHFLWPETQHLALLAGILVLGERATPLRAAGAGGLLALALLSKSLLTPLVPILVLLVIVDARTRRFACAVAMLATLALVLSPTLVQNHRATGRWVVADSSTFNLWLGLNDRGRNGQRESLAWGEYLSYRASGSDARARDAALQRRVAALVAERGWFQVAQEQLGRQYFRLFDWNNNLTEQLPGGAYAELGQGLVATPRPLALFWRVISGCSHFLVLAAFGYGLVWAPAPSRAAPWSSWPLIFLLFHVALYFFLHAKSRYLVQLYPMLLWWAGHAWWKWRGDDRRGDDRRGDDSQRHGWGLLLASLAVFLGFAGGWLDQFFGVLGR